MHTVEVKMRGVQWFVTRSPSSGRWVGACSPLGLVAEADSFSELQGEMNAALDELFAFLLQENILDSWMVERGFTVQMDVPEGVPQAKLRFEVPYNQSVEDRQPAHVC